MLQEAIEILYNDGSALQHISNYMSLSVVEEVNSESVLMPGAAIASMLKVTIWGKASDYVSTGSEIWYLQKEDTDTDWSRVKTFYAQKPTQLTKNTYEIIAYDSISKLDVDLTDYFANIENFTDETTIGDLITAVGEKAGVLIDANNVSSAIKNYKIGWLGAINITARQLLSQIAQISETYLTTTNSGAILFDWYKTNRFPAKEAVPQSVDSATKVTYKQDGLSFEDYNIARPNAVAVLNSDTNVKVQYPTSATDEILVISNTVANAITDPDVLTNIAANAWFDLKQNMTAYKPCTITLFRNDFIQVGDELKVTDLDGNTFWTLVMKKEMSADGMTVTCSGEQSYNGYSSTALENAGNATIDGKKIISISADKIKTGRVESNDGETYFDLDDGEIKSHKVVEIESQTTDDTITVKSGYLNFSRENNFYTSDITLGGSAGDANTGGLQMVFDISDLTGIVGEAVKNFLGVYGIFTDGNKASVSFVNYKGFLTNTTTYSSDSVDEGTGEPLVISSHSSVYGPDRATIDGNLTLNGNITGTYDSGWQNFTYPSSSPNFGNSDPDAPVRYRKIGNIVTLRGSIKPNKSLSANSSFLVGTLPSEYAPTTTAAFSVCSTDDGNMHQARVNTLGNFTVWSHSVGIASNAVLHFNITYFIN